MQKRSKYKKIVSFRGFITGLAIALFAVFGVLGTYSSPVYAQEEKKEDTHFCEEANGKFVQQKDPCIAKEIIKCNPGQANDPCSDPALRSQCKSISCNVLVKNWLDPAIRILTVLMGIIVALSIIFAGIQFATAGSDPGKVAAAKKRISASIIALLGYLFMFSLIQWLLPGGLL